jgi:hypothetical protein
MNEKLKKEDIQKIVLGVLMFIGIVYGYFNSLLGPLKSRRMALVNSISAVEPEIAHADAEIKRVQAVEDTLPATTAITARVDAMIPEAAPVSWFPTLIETFFKSVGFDKSITRGPIAEIPDKELPGYKTDSWTIDVLRADALILAPAVAQLENQEPLLEIQSLTIESTRDDPEAQHVLMTAVNIVKQ